jgi:hypothetical protein
MTTKKLHVRDEKEIFEKGSELKKRRKYMELRDSRIVHKALRGPYEIIDLTEDDSDDEVQYLGTSTYYGPATDGPRRRDEVFCMYCGFDGHSTDQCTGISVGESGITTDPGTEHQSAGQSTAEQVRSMEKHMLDDLESYSYTPTSPPESEPINSDGETNYVFTLSDDDSTYSDITYQCEEIVEDDDDDVANMEENSISGESYVCVKNTHVENHTSNSKESFSVCTTHTSTKTNRGIVGGKREVWLADTGASCHVTPNGEYLHNANRKVNDKIVVGDGSTHNVTATGTLNIKQEGCDTPTVLSNVKVVDNIEKNIISLGLLLKYGATLVKLGLETQRKPTTK